MKHMIALVAAALALVGCSMPTSPQTPDPAGSIAKAKAALEPVAKASTKLAAN